MSHFVFQLCDSAPGLGPDLEAELKSEVIGIVRPSRLPGSKFMEELLVRMSSFVLLQLASPNPTVTSDMQVY